MHPFDLFLRGDHFLDDFFSAMWTGCSRFFGSTRPLWMDLEIGHVVFSARRRASRRSTPEISSLPRTWAQCIARSWRLLLLLWSLQSQCRFPGWATQRRLLRTLHIPSLSLNKLLGCLGGKSLECWFVFEQLLQFKCMHSTLSQCQKFWSVLSSFKINIGWSLKHL